jgi:hypothetical protein
LKLQQEKGWVDEMKRIQEEVERWHTKEELERLEKEKAEKEQKNGEEKRKPTTTVKTSEIINLIGEEEKGEEFCVPIINENTNSKETLSIPSKEKNEEGEKGGNEEKYGDEEKNGSKWKDDSHLGNNDLSHQGEGETSSNKNESKQRPPYGHNHKVSSLGGKGKVTDDQEGESNQGGEKQDKKNNGIGINGELKHNYNHDNETNEADTEQDKKENMKSTPLPSKP